MGSCNIRGEFKPNGKITVELTKDELSILSACLYLQYNNMLTPKGKIKRKYDEKKALKIKELSGIFNHLSNML
jgi:hypothetical protein